MEPSEFRRMARALDNCLRGPRPDPGLVGLRGAVAHGAKDLAPAAFEDWLSHAGAKSLTPFCARIGAMREISMPDIAEAHAEAAEALPRPSPNRARRDCGAAKRCERG